MEYTRGWNGGKIIECEWKDILRNNDQINTINNMITDLRNKTIKNATDGGGKTVKGNIAFATKKVKSEKEEAGKVTRKEGINKEESEQIIQMGNPNGLVTGGGEEKEEVEDLSNEGITSIIREEAVQVADEVQVIEGIRSSRERPDEADQCIKGRVKTTIFMGTGARKRECMRILNGCKNVAELKVKLSTMRI